MTGTVRGNLWQLEVAKDFCSLRDYELESLRLYLWGPGQPARAPGRAYNSEPGDRPAQRNSHSSYGCPTICQ